MAYWKTAASPLLTHQRYCSLALCHNEHIYGMRMGDLYGLDKGTVCLHDDVIKWNHFPRYWPFVRGIHRSPVNSPDKGQWRGALMFSFTCAWINAWVNNREAGNFWRHRAHYDVIVMGWVDVRLYDCFPSKSIIVNSLVWNHALVSTYHNRT